MKRLANRHPHIASSNKLSHSFSFGPTNVFAPHGKSNRASNACSNNTTPHRCSYQSSNELSNLLTSHRHPHQHTNSNTHIQNTITKSNSRTNSDTHTFPNWITHFQAYSSPYNNSN